MDKDTSVKQLQSALAILQEELRSEQAKAAAAIAAGASPRAYAAGVDGGAGAAALALRLHATEESLEAAHNDALRHQLRMQAVEDDVHAARAEVLRLQVRLGLGLALGVGEDRVRYRA
jgi:hypothetical protein